MNRREFLAGGTTVGVTVGMAGCLSRLPFVGGESSGGGDDSEGDTETDEDDEDAGEATGENSTEDDPTDADENETTGDATEGDQNESDENETEYAEAQDPEPKDNSPNESAYEGNESQASEPTASDIDVSSDTLKTDASGATVEATFTNGWHDTIEVLDVEVVFLENGTQVTSVVWGTNDLAAGEQWSYPFRAEGEEYSSVDDYEIYVENIQ